jgi:hypothetical protein
MGKTDYFIFTSIPVVVGCGVYFGRCIFLASCIFSKIALTFLRRVQEYEADQFATAHEYGKELIRFFENSIEDNKRSRTTYNFIR